MENKQKLDIIEIQLGLDVDLHDNKIPNETINKVTQLINNAVKEKEAIVKLKQNQIRDAYGLLYLKMEKSKSGNSENHVMSKELLAISRTNNLSVLIQSINKFIKDRGDIWKLKKKIIKGETAYYLTT